MLLRSLSLASFRSYPTLELTFSTEEKTVVFMGENASGKTNILEAISVLSLLRSLRHAEDADLIRWEEMFYKIRGVCGSDAGETATLEVISQVEPRRRRVASVNDQRTPPNRYIGTLPLITFTPDDLLLFSGPPAARRSLIDTLLCQVSPVYYQALSEYGKVIRQRNALLRLVREGTQRPEGLDVWDERASTLGAVITVDRLQLFAMLQMTILREVTALGERPKSAEFLYVRTGKEILEAAIRDELVDTLRRHRERDILTLSTSAGPHRDDWELHIDHRSITTFASRGQQRVALLALMLLQASFLETRKGEKPILLLDDVFSEFDERHRRALLEALHDHQVFMTAVELDPQLRSRAEVIPCLQNADNEKKVISGQK